MDNPFVFFHTGFCENLGTNTAIYLLQGYGNWTIFTWGSKIRFPCFIPKFLHGPSVLVCKRNRTDNMTSQWEKTNGMPVSAFPQCISKYDVLSSIYKWKVKFFNFQVFLLKNTVLIFK